MVPTAPILDHLRVWLRNTSSAPDADLLTRFAAGDGDAFAAILDRHGPVVWGVCRRVLGDRHAAEDAFQATFLVLARDPRAVRRPESLAAWLHGVAYRLAVRAARRQRQRRVAEANRPTRPQRDPLDELSARELMAVLDSEVERLPEADRAPLILCCLDGCSLDEAAARLGVSRNAVKGRLERSRSRLRRNLEKRGVAVALAAGLALAPTAVARPLIDATLAACLGSAAVPESVATLLAVAPRPRLWVALAVAALGVGVGLTHVGKSPAPEPPPANAPAPAAKRVDKWGDALPDGAVARFGTQRFRQGFLCYSAEFSPDGKWIACASAGEGVCVWDAKTGVRVMQFLGDTHSYSLSFSDNGRYLATTGAGLHVYDLATQKSVWQTGGNQGNLGGETMVVRFAPGSNQVASGGHDNVVRIWDVATGKHLRVMKGHARSVLSLAFSPDGTRLASGGLEDSARVWNPATGEEVGVVKWPAKGPDSDLRTVAFSADGRTLYTGGVDGALRAWDAATFKPGRVIETGHGPVKVIACAPDGKTFVIGSNDGTLSVRDAATGAEVRSWRPTSRPVNCAAFSNDSKLLVTTGSWASSPRVWDVATGRSVKFWDEHVSPVFALYPSRDGRALHSVDRSEVALTWDVATGAARPWFTAPGVSFIQTRVSPDHKTVALTRYLAGPVKLWDVESSKLLRTLDIPESKTRVICQVDFSPDGKHLAAIEGDGVVSIWDWTTGRRLRELTGHANPACVAYSPDGTLLAVGSSEPADHTIKLWNLRTGQECGPVPCTIRMMAIFFSPDGQWLASGGDYSNPVQVWSVATLREGPRMAGQSENGNYSYGFSPDGRFLVGASESKPPVTLVRDVITGAVVQRFAGHATSISSAAFTPDSQALFTGGGDSTILRWDLRHGYLAGESSPKLRQKWWTDLADADAKTALRAVWNLATTPAETAALARTQLKPVAPLSDEQSRQAKQWLAELEGQKFALREKARAELERLGDAALPLLSAAEPKSQEGRRRVKALVENLTAPVPDGTARRDLRAVQALEYAAGAECRKLLDELARGAPSARLTRAAKAAAERMTKARP